MAFNKKENNASFKQADAFLNGSLVVTDTAGNEHVLSGKSITVHADNSAVEAAILAASLAGKSVTLRFDIDNIRLGKQHIETEEEIKLF